MIDCLQRSRLRSLCVYGASHAVLALSLTFALLLGAGMTRAAETKAISLGKLPLLFVDDSGLTLRRGMVPTVHQARTYTKPVLQADRLWEGDRTYIYGSAYQDEKSGLFQLWYGARPGVERGGRSASVGGAPALRNQGFDLTLYATSRDGKKWDKPSLGNVEYNGSTRNNIVSDFHSASVLRDEGEVDPGKRFKMLGYLVRPAHAYHAAYSADGLVWHEYPKSAVLEHGDTITLAQHPVSREYLAYHKRPAQVRGQSRRVVWLSRSQDFQQWSQPELVLEPDEADDAWVSRPQERTEIYNMSVYPHASGFVGLPAMFRVMRQTPREETAPGQSPVDGPIDIQLATSADGRVWKRHLPRVNIIPRGAPGSFDAGTILGVSSTAVHTETETWVFYTAINTGHGGPLPPKRITIGRADWRLHGFVSLDAGPDGGRVETALLRLQGDRLVINADAAAGELRAALCDEDGTVIEGYGLDQFEPMKADATAHAARWRGHNRLPQGRPVKLILEMKNTRLYSVSAR